MNDSQHPPLPDDRLAVIREGDRRRRADGAWMSAAESHVSQLLAELDRLRAENAKLADILNADDQPLLCSDCWCEDCGGREGQHAVGGLCSCGCRPACDRSLRDSLLDQLTEALRPLLGDHPLADAAAHTVWHALNPADRTEEA